MEWATTDGGGASRAVLYTVPNNISALSGVVDQENATFTISGAWSGQAGGGAGLHLFANGTCTGASLRSVAYDWNADSQQSLPHVFEPGDEGFQRGLEYCVKLSLGDANQTFSLGELEYAHISGPSFLVGDGALPSLVGAWSLSHATTAQTKLFKASVSAGNQCDGGELIETLAHGHAGSFSRTWTNSEAAQTIERGVDYCLEILVTDGGGAQTARGVQAPTNNPVLDGAIDQVSGEIVLSATWAGQAGANSDVQLFRSANCSGDALASVAIGYSADSGMTHTFSPDDLVGLERGQAYCAKLRIGQQVEIADLGTLDFVEFESVDLTLADNTTPHCGRVMC